MKLDARFESKNGKLYALKTGAEADTGALIPFDSGVLSGASSEIAETEAQRFSDNSGKILAVYVPHRAVEISENMYDEMYLAALRVFLKSIEAYGAEDQRLRIRHRFCAPRCTDGKRSDNVYGRDERKARALRLFFESVCGFILCHVRR